jgi:cell division protein FtsN
MTTEDIDRKPAVRRRRRVGRGGKGGMPRIMWLAVLVCVAGAVALFRTGGTRNTPSGLGENRTVVTAPETGGTPAASDVEIEGEGLQLTPEKPVAGSEMGGASNQPLEVAVDKPLNETPHIDTTVPPATTGRAVPADPTPDAPAPAPAEQLRPDVEPAEPAAKPAPPPRLEPATQGPYLVQAGSFGDTENAQKEAERLAKLGWPAAVKVGSKAGGGVVYRVQIGYFATREDAQAFIDQNHAKLPVAIPAHR